MNDTVGYFLDQFGPALDLPWLYMDAPELTPALRQQLIDGCRREAAGRSIQALARERDECLIAVLDALERCRGTIGGQ